MVEAALMWDGGYVGLRVLLVSINLKFSICRGRFSNLIDSPLIALQRLSVDRWTGPSDERIGPSYHEPNEVKFSSLSLFIFQPYKNYLYDNQIYEER